MQEDRVSSSSLFLTLTYDTTRVPITKNGFMGLDKKHLQDFWKRLRRALEYRGYDCQIKYYVVGEYGGQGYRPHYHAILFNMPPQLIQRVGIDVKGHMKFRCDIIKETWDNGLVDIGTVSGASVGYTLKYISKPSKIPLHRNDDRLKEFSLMSKGLGKSYLSPQMCKWHLADLTGHYYCTIADGKKIQMPRYYKEKLYDELQRKKIAFHFSNEIVRQQLKDIKEQGDDYWKNKYAKDQQKIFMLNEQNKFSNSKSVFQ